MPNEVENYLATSGKQIYYSGDEIQLITSVLCGYWCLYYLNERQQGKTIFETIHNPNFDLNNQNVNNKYIIHYFSSGNPGSPNPSLFFLKQLNTGRFGGWSPLII